MKDLRLPAIEGTYLPRPGPVRESLAHRVPDPAHAETWQQVSEAVATELALPESMAGAPVCPHFGGFGWRWHPRKLVHYFHAGIDLLLPEGDPVRPVGPGTLLGAWRREVNGNYVVLTHPLVTEDGFRLHSLYLHLRDRTVGYSAVQKVLRRSAIARPWLERSVAGDEVIGRVGDTGYGEGGVVHLHLQLEWRREEDPAVVLFDPRPVLGLGLEPNLTADIASLEEFLDHRAQHEEALRLWRPAIECGLRERG